MLTLLATAALLAQAPVAPPAPPAPPAPARSDSAHAHPARRPVVHAAVTPELARTAFLDPGARTLLLRARAARVAQDSALQSYDAVTYQRFSLGMAFRALVRDRLALREESSGRVRWTRRGGLHVELSGSRAVVPIGGSKGQMKADIDMTPIPWFPGREPLFPLSAFGTLKKEVDEREFVHPLAEGAEAYYRYKTGASQAITLPGGQRIVVRELEITARTASWNAFVGSFWFDEGTGQLVRAAYRLAQPMDVWDFVAKEDQLDALALKQDTALRNRDPKEWERRVKEAEADDDDVPAAVRGMFSPARFDITGITTEYELREGRFWMPRANWAEGTMQLGFLRTPFTLQEKFRYESVNGTDALPTLPAITVADTARDPALDSLSEDGSVTIEIGGSKTDTAAMRQRMERDTTLRGQRRRAREAQKAKECAAGGTYVRMINRFDGALRYPVVIPCDSTKLLASADLPPSIYDDGEDVMDERSRDELLDKLTMGLQVPWTLSAPVKPYWGLNLVRYNRVEGLSSAAGVRWAPGAGWGLDAQARLGTADLQPNGELRVTRSNSRRTIGLGGYHRLVAANDRGDPLSFGASLSHFLYGRDEGFYYRTTGAELTGTRGRRGELAWRLFVEDQRTARKETDYSLAKTFAGTGLLPNIVARQGVVTGAATQWAFSRGLDPRAFRLAGDWRAEGAFGDFDYARTALDATLSHSLTGKADVALTTAGGWSGGAVPPQRQWYLGGAQTVRGEVAGTQSGDAFWLGRLELARAWPVVRPVVFGDIGWAGARDRLFDRPGQPMSGAGMGASFLDGLMRVDVSRGIRPVGMWRMDLYLEARF